MDVQLLRRFDLTQDVNSLYKEILRNVKNENWHWATVSGIWHDFDHLHIFTPMQTSYECVTNDCRYVVKKWINLT